MNTTQLADSLVEDAKKRVQELKEQTADEVQKVAQETDVILKKKEEDFLAEAERAEHEEEQRQEAKRQRDARLAILQRKRELIDDTFDAAADELARMTAANRERLLAKLWHKTTKKMSIGSVVAAKKDATFLRKKTSVKEQDGLGGFIAKSKDGTVSMDMRFETLLQDVKERHVQKIAETLFGGRA